MKLLEHSNWESKQVPTFILSFTVLSIGPKLFPNAYFKFLSSWVNCLLVKQIIWDQNWTLHVEKSLRICSSFKIEPRKYKNKFFTKMGLWLLSRKKKFWMDAFLPHLRLLLTLGCRNKAEGGLSFQFRDSNCSTQKTRYH